MKSVRLGIIGFGGMGQFHARNIMEGKIPRLDVVAAADADTSRFAHFPQLKSFSSGHDLIRSGEVDAVLIATPHYAHTEIGIAALKAGLHVLVEKPISVHRADCEKLNAAHKNPRQVYAAMFNQRTDPRYVKIRDLVKSGEIGEVRRINWIITNWFRTAAYYSSGSWRATWAGEGGGVLLNQCPHNLDLFYWIFGQPSRVHGFCQFGRYHPIEVEDDVTAYFEMPAGAHASFIASTGEAPGTNRLEITAERGRLVCENDRLTWLKNEVPMSEFSSTATKGFAVPKTTEVDLPFDGPGEQHVGILKNFVAAILNGAPLIAPAAEGIYSVELANAVLLSQWTGKSVALPMSGATYKRWLNKKITESKSAMVSPGK